MTGTEPLAEAATTLHPAGRVLWRAADAAQLEVGTRRVIVDGVGSDVVRYLLGRAPTAPGGAHVAALQQRLVEDGFLWPAGGDHDPRRSPPRPRLAAELAALATRTGQRAAEYLQGRGSASVAIEGAGRLGPHIGAVLAAAGVGRVHVLETSPVRLHHAMPGGVGPVDEGAPLASAAAAALRRYAPEVDCMPLPFGQRPDLVILAPEEPVDQVRRDALHSGGCAHLLVRLDSDHGVVGPLVLPGLTSCLRCADLHRLDRDPAWNALAVQLTVPHRAAKCGEVALAAVIGGLAAMQALDFLDGGRPATVEGALEMHPPDWRVRRRSWPVHPDCDCMPAATPEVAARSAAGSDSGGPGVAAD